ncbi:NAD(P)-dependent alcohol dehydrogenase [Anaerolineales bacterium]
MKAVMAKKYGSADMLEIREVEKPSPKAREVLIKIHEAVVTPTDVAVRSGKPFMVRFFSGFFAPKGALGSDLVGEIEAVGEDVVLFKVGDQVFGATGGAAGGSHAEYVCLPEDAIITTKPANRSNADVAGISDGAITALTFLRDVAKIQSGQKVLINGASGSVGGFGVQIAHYFGAEVTGVCSGKNAALVKSLGAEHVIDYTQEDFTQNLGAYDIIFDAIGKSSFPRCKGALKADGLYLTTVPSLGIVWHMLSTRRSHKKAIFSATGLSQTIEKLHFLKEMIEAGHLKAVLDRHYPLSQIRDAHRYVESERKTGNVIIRIAS